jgi:hypothetical protein
LYWGLLFAPDHALLFYVCWFDTILVGMAGAMLIVLLLLMLILSRNFAILSGDSVLLIVVNTDLERWK